MQLTAYVAQSQLPFLACSCRSGMGAKGSCLKKNVAESVSELMAMPVVTPPLEADVTMNMIRFYYSREGD